MKNNRLEYSNANSTAFMIRRNDKINGNRCIHFIPKAPTLLLICAFACQLSLSSFSAWGGDSTSCPASEADDTKCVGPIVGKWRYGADYLSDNVNTHLGFTTLDAALDYECESAEQRFPSCTCKYGEPTPFVNANDTGAGHDAEYGYDRYWFLGEETKQINRYFGEPGVIFYLTFDDTISVAGGTIERIREVDCPSGYRVNGTPYDADYTGVPLSYCVVNVKKVIRTDRCVTGGNPVVIGNGNKHQVEYDCRSETIEFYRTYNSRNYDVAPDNEPMGKQWRHNYERYLTIPAITEVDGAIRSFYALRPDGSVNHFRLNGGEIISDTGINDRIERAYDVNREAIGWNYITGNGATEFYNDRGMLVSITSPQGRVVSLTYNDNWQLISVGDDAGRSLKFTYDDSGHIATITNPNEETYTYTYTNADNLASVTYPDATPSDTTDNPQRVYHYEDTSSASALTGITDENGNRFATWAYDTQGRAISSEHASGVEKTLFDYSYLDSSSDPRVTVTNPLGKQTTYHFVVIDDMRKVTQVEGHPTNSCEGANKSYQYDANGNVISKTDWNGVTTTYTYDMTRNLELSRTEAKGTPQERTITTEWHPNYRLPLRITEPDRITEYSYDAQGRRLTSKTSSVQ